MFISWHRKRSCATHFTVDSIRYKYLTILKTLQLDNRRCIVLTRSFTVHFVRHLFSFGEKLILATVVAILNSSAQTHTHTRNFAAPFKCVLNAHIYVNVDETSSYKIRHKKPQVKCLLEWSIFWLALKVLQRLVLAKIYANFHFPQRILLQNAVQLMKTVPSRY